MPILALCLHCHAHLAVCHCLRFQVVGRRLWYWAVWNLEMLERRCLGPRPVSRPSFASSLSPLLSILPCSSSWNLESHPRKGSGLEVQFASACEEVQRRVVIGLHVHLWQLGEVLQPVHLAAQVHHSSHWSAAHHIRHCLGVAVAAVALVCVSFVPLVVARPTELLDDRWSAEVFYRNVAGIEGRSDVHAAFRVGAAGRFEVADRARSLGSVGVNIGDREWVADGTVVLDLEFEIGLVVLLETFRILRRMH